MKTSIKNFIQRSRLKFLVLLTAFVYVIGCTTSHVDPVAGWQRDFSEEPNQIVNDYQNYIRQLSPQERQDAGVSDWLKDGTGQHAIVIAIPLNGRWWRHVLIYDKANERTKVIVYKTGAYRS